jgi:signal transduction histidine kinase
MAGFFTRRNQLQWLALLVIAVLLPTVSLLWFMSRVIADERLVVPQKLAALYKDKLADATARTESLYAAQLAALEEVKPGANPYSLFRRLVLENKAQGMVLWDEAGVVQYPQAEDVMGHDVSPGNPLAEAWQLEFVKHQYDAGAKAYGKFTTYADRHVALAAVAGRTRCLSKQGKMEEAIEACQRFALAQPADKDDPAAHLGLAVENWRLLLLFLLKQSSPSPGNLDLFRRTVNALVADLYNTNGQSALLPANQNLFLARKVLEASSGQFALNDVKVKSDLDALVPAEEVSIAAAETQRPVGGQPDVFFRTALAERPVYGLRHRLGSSTVLVLFSDAGIASMLAGYRDTFSGTESAYRILDAAGEFVTGTTRPEGKPYTVASLPLGFPGWKAELYFQGGDIFKKAAERQVAVYAWTGFLVIVLILIAAAFAARAVGRQIRLNEMKNDFIATVTHELKTPLASMRVLVDTLLEGNVADEAQRIKYLHLAAKENERLSRMIDNFLTFSRMERNKVAFTFADARPEAMTSDATEAVRTKYAANNCHLSVNIAKDLPEIQADHDAIVTVLVNLLDNACKYTSENKQVSLKVFADTDCVFFAVADNGIGLARRHLRKIFDRFYQVDSSLARKAEGCGLGLSIVKFIVDAHKGKITVESKPGQGSSFTVKLPIGHGSSD